MPRSWTQLSRGRWNINKNDPGVFHRKNSLQDYSWLLRNIVLKIKTDPFGEDVSLLYPNKRVGVFVRYPEAHCETPIIKGVANQLRRWPEDIFFAFLAACLIIGCIAFLIFVTVIICLPTVLGNR